MELLHWTSYRIMEIFLKCGCNINYTSEKHVDYMDTFSKRLYRKIKAD